MKEQKSKYLTPVVTSCVVLVVHLVPGKYKP